MHTHVRTVCVYAYTHLAVFKLMKKETGSTYKFVHAENVSFPQVHTLDISHCGISSTGKFLITSSHDMKVVLYDIHGNILKILEPKLSSLFDVSLSPDGRFVAVCGFTPDVFVYEVLFNRDGLFQDVKKAFDLKGHNSGVFAVAFNAGSTRTVTVSRDGYWRLFDTDIRYAQGQEATILMMGEWPMLKGASAEQVRLAMSPSGGSFAITCVPSIHGDQCVLVIRYSPCGRLIATCGDRYIRIFRNIPEYYSEIVRLNRSLASIWMSVYNQALMCTTGDAAKRRIHEQIKEAKKMSTLIY
ncbi:WD domain, G-beta repeat protein [Dictyocaulus viviparus]|uniref:WD domain, G-beta repeat protein n=1 Tax=Dictyocaulus viviparus TaxID=29172 RepID=A0A0D8XZ61_DICVI|nr:WD domain, G-beta repeat protein [Dictyocaulus viviparus]